MTVIPRSPQGQAQAPRTQPFGAEAFAPQQGTAIRWLGGAGALINSRGTTLMIDPVLEGFDMPLLADAPIRAGEVPRLDAVLLTHCDNDHFSREPAAGWGRCAAVSTRPIMWRGWRLSWACPPQGTTSAAGSTWGRCTQS